MISGFRRDVDEICDLLGYYTALCGNYLFSYSESWPVRMGPIRCPETSVNNYHTTPCNNPEDHTFQKQNCQLNLWRSRTDRRSRVCLASGKKRQLFNIPKKRKNVVWISSLHFDGTFDRKIGDQLKPEIATFYNRTKCGVDMVDQMCSTWQDIRDIGRWWYSMADSDILCHAQLYRNQRASNYRGNKASNLQRK